MYARPTRLKTQFKISTIKTFNSNYRLENRRRKLL